MLHPETGTMVCVLDEVEILQSPGKPMPPGPLELELYTWSAASVVPALVDMNVTRVIVRGAVPLDGPGRDDPVRLAHRGDPGGLETLSAGGGVTAAWAAAELGRAHVDALAGLSEREVQLLLRTRPNTWNVLVADRFEGRLGELWGTAWGGALHFGVESAKREVLHPELATVSLATPAGREVALERGRALVGEGRLAEARREFERLVEADDPEGVIELAELALAGGREGEVGELLARLGSMREPTTVIELLDRHPLLRERLGAWDFPVAVPMPIVRR